MNGDKIARAKVKVFDDASVAVERDIQQLLDEGAKILRMTSSSAVSADGYRPSLQAVVIYVPGYYSVRPKVSEEDEENFAALGYSKEQIEKVKESIEEVDAEEEVRSSQLHNRGEVGSQARRSTQALKEDVDFEEAEKSVVADSLGEIIQKRDSDVEEVIEGM